MHFEFFVKVIGKSTTAFLTGHSWHILESCYTDGGPELGFRHCLEDRLNKKMSSRAANNFPAGAGQIVRSNLFLLGHIPFLAGQTSITSYRYKSTPSPLHMMFKYETSKFSKHLLYMSIDLNAGKVERMVQQNQYHICAYYYCLSSTSYNYTVSYEVDEID